MVLGRYLLDSLSYLLGSLSVGIYSPTGPSLAETPAPERTSSSPTVVWGTGRKFSGLNPVSETTDLYEIAHDGVT